MMRSLFSGVSGLKSHQTRMDVIGNNIANVNTTGFKSSRTTFADTLSQTLTGASSPQDGLGGTNPKQIGLGTGVGSIDMLFTDGSVQSTGKNTDLCLSGNGLFVVKNGNETYYTRDGAFEFDANGNYVLPGSGLKVQGWVNTGTNNNKVDTTGATADIVVQAGKTMEAKETSQVQYAYNLNASSPVITKYSFSVTDANGKTTSYTKNTAGMYITASDAQPVTLEFSDGTKQTVTSGTYTIGHSLPQTTAFNYYDSLGGKHTATVLLEKVSLKDNSITYTDSDGNKKTDGATSWVAHLAETSVDETDGSKTTLVLGAVTLAFDTTGKLREGNGLKAETVTADTDSKVKTTNPPVAASGTSGATMQLAATHFTPNGSHATNMSLDFNGVTQYAGMSTVNATADGNAAGTLSSISVDKSGVIVGTYTNGVKRSEAQVAIAQFTNASGLTKTGNSLYQESNNSGTANVKTASDLGVTITPSALEMSNVDIANEFSDMIITQRGFQSNSKIITVSDEMLETVINMKR